MEAIRRQTVRYLLIIFGLTTWPMLCGAAQECGPDRGDPIWGYRVTTISYSFPLAEVASAEACCQKCSSYPNVQMSSWKAIDDEYEACLCSLSSSSSELKFDFRYISCLVAVVVKNQDESTVQGDPHMKGFDGTELDVKGEDGQVYNLLSERQHAITAKLAQVPPVMVDSLWMTEIGAVLCNNITLAAKLKLDTYTPTFNDAWKDANRQSRMVYSHIRDVMALEVNGQEVDNLLHSRQVIELQCGGGNFATVHSPDGHHEGEPATDGPVLTLRTEHMDQVGVHIETEGVLHLDISVQLLKPLGEMHGLLGQTAEWAMNQGTNTIQGAERDYIVHDLLATDYRFSKFCGRNCVRGRSLIGIAKLRDLAGLSAGHPHVVGREKGL